MPRFPKLKPRNIEMTNLELSKKCHEAIDTLALVLEKLVDLEDDGLEVEVLKCVPPWNFLYELLKNKKEN